MKMFRTYIGCASLALSLCLVSCTKNDEPYGTVHPEDAEAFYKRQAEQQKNPNATGGGTASTVTPAQSTTVKATKEEWVDFGDDFNVLWNSCNVGAQNPWEYGNYFAWGEVTAKKTCGGDNSETYNKEVDFLESKGYIKDNCLLPDHDAAAKHLKGSRMPTLDEMQELTNYCNWQWTDNYEGKNVPGYVVSKKGKSIFLPMGGYLKGKVQETGMMFYWLSTLHLERIDMADAFLASKSKMWLESKSDFRYHGSFVRPVRPKENVGDKDSNDTGNGDTANTGDKDSASGADSGDGDNSGSAAQDVSSDNGSANQSSDKTDAAETGN